MSTNPEKNTKNNYLSFLFKQSISLSCIASHGKPTFIQKMQILKKGVMNIPKALIF